MGDSAKTTDKKAYEKPQIRIIELAADEILAAGCKTNSASPAVGGGVTCAVRGCAAIGS
jgi:hypothetical protein